MWKTIYLKEEEEVFEENNLFEDISEENGLLENRSPVMEVVSIPTVANLENYPVIAGLSHSTDVNDRIQQEMGGSIENDVLGYGFSSYDFSQIYDQYPSSAGYDLAKLSDNAQKSVLSPTGSGCNLTGRSDQSQISHQSQSGSGSNMTKPSGKSQISVQPPTGNLAGAPVGVGDVALNNVVRDLKSDLEKAQGDLAEKTEWEEKKMKHVGALLAEVEDEMRR